MEIALPITALFAAIAGIMLFGLSINAGLYRVKSKIFILDGGDNTMARKIRAQGNFIEYTPMALILLALIELQGASETLVYVLGTALIVGRIAHAQVFLTNESTVGPGRAIGMLATFAAILGAAGWLLYHQFA